MRIRWILFFGAAMLAGALGGTWFGPAPAGAVAREIIELQSGVTELIQGQQSLQTQMTQNAAVQRTLIEQSLDAVTKLNTSMSAVQKTTQDFSAASGARRRKVTVRSGATSQELYAGGALPRPAGAAGTCAGRRGVSIKGMANRDSLDMPRIVSTGAAPG